MLQGDERILLMSTRAYQSLKESQVSQIQKYARIIHTALPTIEDYGGGSARCMVAELFTWFMDINE